MCRHVYCKPRLGFRAPSAICQSKCRDTSCLCEQLTPSRRCVTVSKANTRSTGKPTECNIMLHAACAVQHFSSLWCSMPMYLCYAHRLQQDSLDSAVQSPITFFFRDSCSSITKCATLQACSCSYLISHLQMKQKHLSGLSVPPAATLHGPSPEQTHTGLPGCPLHTA